MRIALSEYRHRDEVAAGKERLLSITLCQGERFLLFEISNTYAPEAAGAKKARGGYGLKNMAAVAEKYGGSVDTKAEGDVFRVTVLNVYQASSAYKCTIFK